MKCLYRIVAVVAYIATTFLFSACGESFTDPRDGQKYKTVKIGDQVWMAENLKYKGGAAKIFENGKVVYTWDSALVACPDGWYLPSKTDVEQIKNKPSFKDTWIWSSTEKKNLTLYAYGNFVSNDSTNIKSSWYGVRCIKGKGNPQEYLRDINGYKAVRIGTQIWMADNLNIKTPNSICYLEDEEECENGRFYDLTEAKKVCPDGWHLPTGTEAKILANKISLFSNSDVDYAMNMTKSFAGPVFGLFSIKEKKFQFDRSSDKPIVFLRTSEGSFVRIYGKMAMSIDVLDSVNESLVKSIVRCIADVEENKMED